MYHYVFLLCTKAKRMRSISTSLQEPRQWFVLVLVNCFFDPRFVFKVQSLSCSFLYPIWGLTAGEEGSVWSIYFTQEFEKSTIVE